LRTIRPSSSGSFGFKCRGDGGARFRIWSERAAAESPSNGGLPVDISKRTIPSENKSVRASTGLPSICSGDM
jgi:hypothetical protein